jgi:riboflavin synthase
MFTGIIEAMGTIVAANAGSDGLELTIAKPWADVAEGESIAVNGACLTVERVGDGTFTFHVIQTSLERTAFGTYEIGQRVNLERALPVGARLGGHFVQGHVDAVGIVRRSVQEEDARLVDIAVPREVEKVSMPLGSITVDGVSLTINAIPSPGVIQISLIPFTLRHTTLNALEPSVRVHVEGDMIGKYVSHLMGGMGKP